jgi:hypothetical protein
MTGTVTKLLGRPKSMCHITDTTGQTYFAHRKHFVDQALMVVGTDVEFLVAAPRTGQLLPVALEVVAIQRKAA